MRSRLTSLLLPFAVCVLLFVPSGSAFAQFFPQPTLVPTSSQPVAIYSADVNGDGIPDLIYIDSGATPAASLTHVLLGNGTGGFTQSATIATAGDSIAVGDLTGNGRVDIGWVTYTGPPVGGAPNTILHIAPGTGTGTFSPTLNLPAIPINSTQPLQFEYTTIGRLHDTPSTPSNTLNDVIVEDINNGPGTVFTFRPSATTPGTAEVTLATLVDGPGPATVARLNPSAGAHNQLVVNSVSKYTAQVFGSTGFGIPPGAVPFRVSGISGVHSLLIQDVNGDGIPDMIVEGAAGRIDVLAGDGSGKFAPPSIGGTGALDGTTGNGGHLISLNPLGPAGSTTRQALTATPAGISSLLGVGSAFFGLKGIYNAGPGRTAYATADFNKDGILDLAVDSPEGIVILFGNADGSFQTNSAYASIRPALASTPGVFNSTGHTDIVVATSSTQGQLLAGQGDGTFIPAPGLTTAQAGNPALLPTVQAGDFNKDGKLDLAFTATGLPLPTAGSGVAIAYGNGDGSFRDPVAVTPPGGNLLFGYSGVGDFNGDGTADLANVDGSFYDTLLGVPGQTSALFTLGLHAPEASNAYPFSTLATGFFKVGRAGKQDLIMQDGPDIVPFANSGDGVNFTRLANLPTPSPSSFTAGQILFGDLDGDGFSDVVIPFYNLGSGGASLEIFYGNGDGTFGAPVVTTLGRNYYLSALGDVNGDGFPDLVFSDGSLVGVLLNQGKRNFAPEVHFLAGQGINQIAFVDPKGTGTLDLIATNGGAVISSGIALGGTKPGATVVTLPKNLDVDNGGITVLRSTVLLKTVSGTLKASPEPSFLGQAFTITATLVPPTGGVALTGNVTFSVDGVLVGTSTLTNGVATIAGPTTLTAGPPPHALTAVYSGDSNYQPNATLTGSHTVTAAGSPTTVTLTPTTATTIYYGQLADGTYVVNGTDPNHKPTGTITLQDNGVNVPICTNLPVGSPCNYGTAQLLQAGTHSLVLFYNGDAFNAPGKSNTVIFIVKPDLTTASITSSPNYSVLGAAVTFTATLKGNFAVPVGTVNFVEGSTVLGSGAIDSTGHATFTTSTLSLGHHIVTVVYDGTPDFNPVTSSPVDQLVVATSGTLQSKLKLTSNVNPSTLGQLVSFTATVTLPPGSTPPVAPGTVAFSEGPTVLGSAPLDNTGTAIFATNQLALGVHNITATYAGQTAGSAGSPVISGSQDSVQQNVNPPVVVVAPPSFVLTVTPTPVSVDTGLAAVLLVKVQSVSGFNQAVQLSCSGLPPESKCLFVQATLPAGGGSTTLQLLTSAPHDCGDPNHPYFLGAGNRPGAPIGTRALPFAAPLLAGFFLLLLPRRKARTALRKHLMRGSLLLLALVASLSALSGCGRCTDLGTRPGVYHFTLTATPQGSPITQSQSIPVQLTVTIPGSKP